MNSLGVVGSLNLGSGYELQKTHVKGGVNAGSAVDLFDCRVDGNVNAGSNFTLKGNSHVFGKVNAGSRFVGITSRVGGSVNVGAGSFFRNMEMLSSVNAGASLDFISSKTAKDVHCGMGAGFDNSIVVGRVTTLILKKPMVVKTSKIGEMVIKAARQENGLCNGDYSVYGDVTVYLGSNSDNRNININSKNVYFGPWELCKKVGLFFKMIWKGIVKAFCWIFAIAQEPKTPEQPKMPEPPVELEKKIDKDVQVLELIDTVIKSDLTFEGGNGLVVLKGSSKVHGAIIGATLVDE